LPKGRSGIRIGHDRIYDHMMLDGLEDAYEPGRAMGTFGEQCADKYQFTREAQDAFAIASVQRAKAATDSGAFKAEITPVTVKTRSGEVLVAIDEGPGKVKLDKISSLKPAFKKDGTITAASSSSINDGAAALVLARASTAKALGAKPIANLDVFCVAPPDTPAADVPPGVIHPRRLLAGVAAGVRDYGNRMGIPTIAGAVAFHPGYIGNPLVFCGTVGIMPRGHADAAVEPGDLVVVAGGRTGRDGIHGATFSSVELSSDSESQSGGSVQIGHAIHEKMLTDFVLEASRQRLFHAITDCGAGGLSSAVGEMAATLGAEVDLDRVPLKYDGLSATEAWISEAQERMVLAVAPADWEKLSKIAADEGVEATAIGTFTGAGRLVLRWQGRTAKWPLSFRTPSM
jgi:phosphoribosylaminoimidazole (AIR) synthetase